MEQVVNAAAAGNGLLTTNGNSTKQGSSRKGCDAAVDRPFNERLSEGDRAWCRFFLFLPSFLPFGYSQRGRVGQDQKWEHQTPSGEAW